MMKTLLVAKRDFLATVLTKGFILGVLIMPLIGTAAAPLAILLMNRKPPPVEGAIAFVDQTGQDALSDESLTQEISKLFSPASIEEWVRSQASETTATAKKVVEQSLPPDQIKTVGPLLDAAAKAVEVPKLKIDLLPPQSDIEALKLTLLPVQDKPAERLALVVIEKNAVSPTDGEEFGSYQLYIRPRLDIRVQSMIRAKMRDAVVASRLKAGDEDPVRIKKMTQVSAPETKTVTTDGDKSGSEMSQMFVPLAFMMLLWISTFTGGQFLLTSTIEEKSNRIMEVLLSAVSPLELLVGKIIGQMGAGLLILVLYSSLGMASLIALGQTHLVDWGNLVLLVVYFLLAFGFIACVMAAIGSAVNDIHEAQSLMTPVMLVVLAPMLLMMPIIFDPRGVLATTMSFIPGIGPFVMVLRLSSSDPPPFWQVGLSILIGIITVIITAKIAAKIFRIGVLMYGKPPNFATLIKWVRMA